MTTLKDHEAKAGGHEKRRFSRMEVHVKIAVAAMADAVPVRLYAALTRDVSYTGMGLTQAAACKTGDRLAVRLPSGPKSAIALFCTVMHCRPLADGIYGVGIEFTDLLPPDFIEKAAQSPEMQRRRIQNSILG